MFDIIDEDFIDDDIVMAVVDQDIDDELDADEDLMNDCISDSDAIDIVMGAEDGQDELDLVMGD